MKLLQIKSIQDERSTSILLVSIRKVKIFSSASQEEGKCLLRPQRNKFNLGELTKSKKLENGNRNLGTNTRKYVCRQPANLSTQTSPQAVQTVQVGDEVQDRHNGTSSNQINPG